MPTYNNTGANNYEVAGRIFAAGMTGFQTTSIIDHLAGVVRTSDLPVFNLIRARHDKTFSGAGSETVNFADPELLRSILITASVDVDMHINLANNDPPKRLLAGKEYWIAPNGMIDALVFDHQDAGVVIVEEVGPPTPEEPAGEGVTFGGESVTFGGEGVTW